MLLLIYYLLILVNIFLQKHIFLTVDQVLEFARLADGVRGLFEPLLVGFEVGVHLLISDVDGLLDEFFIIQFIDGVHEKL
jgi:hypothetical protein